MRLALLLAAFSVSGCFQEEYSWSPRESDPDTSAVMGYWTGAAEAGDPDAQFHVALVRHVTYGDPKRAFPVFERLAAGGHARSASAMARAHMYGDGVSVDYDKAMHWLRRAAELGDTEAARSVTAYEANAQVRSEGTGPRPALADRI